jgi:hypothetical protein
MKYHRVYKGYCRENRGVFVFLLIPVLFFILAAQVPSLLASENNALNPTFIPPGFTLEKPPQVFGAPEHKLQDGSIFDYIDGGGVVYQKYNFSRLTHADFKDKEDNRIILDIFEFSTETNAKAAFADELICPPGFSHLDLAGTLCKAYAFSPEFFLYFIKDNRLVYVYASNDAQADILKQFALLIIKEGKK